MTLKTTHNEKSDYNNNNSASVPSNELHVVYNAAMILRDIVQNKPAQSTPWPPLGSDFTMENAKKAVPSQLMDDRIL